MQAEAARAQARQHGTSSRYLPKVPLTVVPLLPSGSPSSTPKPPNPSGPRIPTPSAVGLALSEACLCRMLSADSGTHRSPQCALHARKGTPTPPPSRDGGRTYIPSPPHTPPRPAIPSLPPPTSPPRTAKLKNFGFVPLLGSPSDSGSGSSSMGTVPPVKKEADTKHGLITPPLSAKPSWTQLAPQSSQPNAYSPNFSMVGTNATSLGLERKLGFSFGSSPQSSSESDSEPEAEVEESEDEQDWRLKELRARELKQRKERMSPPPRRRPFTLVV